MQLYFERISCYAMLRATPALLLTLLLNTVETETLRGRLDPSHSDLSVTLQSAAG